ncbi:zinc-ribbon domain-containing protein [Streptomyces sp. NPDC048473]|uniref:zinc-ribbon domain-containing protein n=1 Tax=unclassified Streptomyces TaxID=2593676 RepID=UPI00371C9E1C
MPDARPDLAAEWHPTRNDIPSAAHITAGSHRVVWWESAACADEFRAKAFHRVRGLAKRPACSGRVRYQDLASESPRSRPCDTPS